MRYCLSCRKITTGDPTYCNFCGKSYDVKLCGRGHINIRLAGTNLLEGPAAGPHTVYVAARRRGPTVHTSLW
jgi:hypothetical protein